MKVVSHSSLFHCRMVKQNKFHKIVYSVNLTSLPFFPCIYPREVDNILSCGIWSHVNILYE